MVKKKDSTAYLGGYVPAKQSKEDVLSGYISTNTPVSEQSQYMPDEKEFSARTSSVIPSKYRIPWYIFRRNVTANVSPVYTVPTGKKFYLTACWMRVEYNRAGSFGGQPEFLLYTTETAAGVTINRILNQWYPVIVLGDTIPINFNKEISFSQPLEFPAGTTIKYLHGSSNMDASFWVLGWEEPVV